MDWRKFCKKDLQNSKKTESLLSWIKQFPSGDEQFINVLKGRGIISFPHTVLDYSGEMTTRVVTSLYASGVEKVVALGVIHVGALPERYKTPFTELLDPNVDPRVRKEHLEVFQGGFIRSEMKTAFGKVPSINPKSDWKRIRKDDDLLAGEFCLDYFLGILRFVADQLGREVLSVLPIYSGASFDPVTGSFELATEVANEISQVLDSRTALVITGDLVHYGTTYSSKEAMKGKPVKMNELVDLFLPLVNRSFQLTLHEKRHVEAFNLMNDVLHSDQRLLLPVVSEILGAKPSYEIVEFHLSDYAPIWHVDGPCVVASSLVSFLPTADISSKEN